MKKILIILLITIFSCSKPASTTTQSPVLNITTTPNTSSKSNASSTTTSSTNASSFTASSTAATSKGVLTLYDIGIIELTDHTPQQTASALSGGGSGAIYFVKNGVEHYIIPGTLFFSYPLTPVAHFVNNGDGWTFSKEYLNVRMGAGRDYEILNENIDLIYADFGPELKDGSWPGGDIWIADNIGLGNINWTKINKEKKFWHSVSSGDLNGDSLNDIVAVNLADILHIWRNTGDNNSFIKTVPSFENFDNNKTGFSAVKIFDINGDGKEEIIAGSDSSGGGFFIYEDLNSDFNYEEVFTSGKTGVFDPQYGNKASTSINLTDIDLDGDFDLIIATENGQPPFGEIFQVWIQTENFNFIPGQIFDFFDVFQSREFDLFDIDNDGDEDLIFNVHGIYFLDENNLHPNSFVSSLSRENGGVGSFDFDKLIYYNDNGTFKIHENNVDVSVEKDIFGYKYIKPYFTDEGLKFIGYYYAADYAEGGVELPSKSYIVEYDINIVN